jgi:hypothetical protein
VWISRSHRAESPILQATHRGDEARLVGVERRFSRKAQLESGVLARMDTSDLLGGDGDLCGQAEADPAGELRD